MTIKGTLEDIIFRNEENGYTVAVLDVDGEPITVVGNFPLLAEGEYLECEGEYKQNSKYGRQFVVERLSTAAPDSEIGVLRFLMSGLIRGVGEVTATNIVNRFGKNALDVIENDYEKLAKIRGISLKKARDIHDSYELVAGMRHAVIFLQNHGIGSSLAVKIYTRYGAATQALVTANPYRLVEDVDGVGFVTADRIATSLGIAKDSGFRARAGIMHLFREASEQSGHTYLPLPELHERLATLLDLAMSYEETESLCAALAISGVLRMERGEPTRVMLVKLYRLEKGIADKLNLMLLEATDGGTDCQRYLAQYERMHGVEFHAHQRDAVLGALSHGVSVITGGPGTGKTTIVRSVVWIAMQLGHTVTLLAPTGRAAKRLSEATARPASTIHRELGSEGENRRFSHNETNPLEATFVIVDEVSMVDVYLMHALLRALRPGTKLLLVGDKDQLPSVGAGNVLGDILASGVVPVARLTQVYRQAQQSLIVTNAHRINAGELPQFKNGADSDFFFLQREQTTEIRDTIVEMVTKRLPAYLGKDPSCVQVLAPVKNGVSGVHALNLALQSSLNPPRAGEITVSHGDVTYRTGDKVMHIVNDYELEWTRRDSLRVEEGVGVFNGDIGTITEILQSKEITVTYEDGKVVRYDGEHLDELMPAYAITVHKSQGCEFDAIVMPILTGSPMLLTRNLLYTGITRAKTIVVLVGTRYALSRMIANDFTQKRYSNLCDLLVNTSTILTAHDFLGEAVKDETEDEGGERS